MFDRLLSPIVKDEEIVTRAKALNLLALVTAALVLIYSILMAITSPQEIAGLSGIALLIAFILSMGCYWLGRQGRVRLAGYILFSGLFVAISLNMLNPPNTISDLTMNPFLYILVVLPAGYVLHPRISFLAATLAMIYTVGLFLIAPPQAYAAYQDKANYWSNAGLAFALYFILSAVAWIFSQGIDEALQKAKQQNRELQEVTQEIEAKRQLQEETGHRILELAERLAQYSQRQARGSSRQAAAVAQVSSSTEELNQAAQEIAGNATMVDGAAQHTLQDVQEGQNIISDHNEAMGLIQAKAQQGAQEATDLEAQLKRINRVATIMSSIASQIQLVAFNATLEAAEAGEAGQRFGVVASEVKDLAADSLKQAKQVAQIIHEVQEAGESVMNLSSEQVEAVQRGAVLMEHSRAANDAITASATEMAERAKQIQLATAQQQQASEQVVASMQEIKTVVDRWVVSSYQMDDLVSGLKSLAEQLA
jgi:methyl-accepting chemotaxis protein